MGLEAGTVGAVIVIAWVVVAEIDQAFASFVAAGSETVGIIRFLPTRLIGLLAVGGIVAIAYAVPAFPVPVASAAAAVVLPAALIAAFDFTLVNERYYAESDIYGSTERLVNPAGLLCWLTAVVVGQLLDPVGPQEWLAAIPDFGLTFDLPWRLVVALVMATIYLLIARWSSRREAAVYGIRGAHVRDE